MPRTAPQFETMDDVLMSLGGISPKRVRWTPTPGTATEKDVIRLLHREKRKFELVDGTLVEKVMGMKESTVAAEIIHLIKSHFDRTTDLGMVAGADGTVKFLKGLIRIPDVSFTRWDRLPGGVVPSEPIPNLAPDLAVEVLSKGNTKGEMERKLKEYFLAGVELVWFVDPDTRTVRVYTSPDDSTELATSDTLTGGDVLPGFKLKIAELFKRLPGSSTKPRKKNGRS